MAEEEYHKQTALAVVEEQQKIVGAALVGGAGAGVMDASSDSQSQILEQIREIQLNTLRAIRQVATNLTEMLDFEKDAERRQREDATENLKEGGPDFVGPMGGGEDIPPEVEKKAGGMFAFLGMIPGAGFLKKMFLPITAFFGKSGLLVKLFGRFGPLGALILGFTLVYKYSDEIAEALTPAIDKIKDIIVKLQPLLDWLTDVGDFLIKTLLGTVGDALTLVVTAVEGVVDGFKMIFEGDILGGLNRMFGLEEGLLGFLLELPKKIFDKTVEFLGGLAEAMGIDFKALYDNIAGYVTDTINNIKLWMTQLKDNIIQFFVDAWESAKTTMSNAVGSAFDFLSNIFDTIKNFFIDSYKNAKDYVVGLPGKILGFIKGMFSPIVDFFTGIGNRIKEAINGIIDSLPIPDWLKGKMKFDVEPTQKDLDAMQGDAALAEEIAMNEKAGLETIAGKYKFKDGVLQQNGRDLEIHTKDFAEDIAKEIGDQVKLGYNDKTNKYVIVRKDKKLGEAPKKELLGQSDTALTGVDELDNELITETKVKLPAKNIKEVKGILPPTIINNINNSSSTSSVANKTDVHSGNLDVGVDGYHDKVAVNAMKKGLNARGFG